jgi:hypothetical protein
MKKMTHATITLIATLAVLLAAVDVAQAVNYQEDFSGAGTALSDFGFGTQGFLNTPHGVGSAPGLGEARAAQESYTGHWKLPITKNPFSTDPIWHWQADVYMGTNPGDNWVGVQKSACCNNEGLNIGGHNTVGWALDARQMPDLGQVDETSVGGFTEIGQLDLGAGTTGYGTPVTVQMEINSTTSSVRVMLTDRDNPSTVHADRTIALTAADLAHVDANFSHFVIQNAGASGFTGMEVDNILIDYNAIVIPEPTTLALTGLGLIGLLAFSRRRRMR